MKTLTPRGFLFPAPAFDALSGRQVLSSSETNSIPAPSRIGSQQHSGSTHRHDLRVLPQLPQKPESTARLSIPPVAQTLPLPIQRNRCFAQKNLVCPNVPLHAASMSSNITPAGVEISLAFDSHDRSMVVTDELNHHRWPDFSNAHSILFAQLRLSILWGIPATAPTP